MIFLIQDLFLPSELSFLRVFKYLGLSLNNILSMIFRKRIRFKSLSYTKAMKI